MSMKKFRKKYYLNKMRQGQLTDIEVAKILNTTESHVQGAFVQFCQEKKPFNIKRRFATVTHINIMISILSLAVIWFTLLEMQMERNNAYKPDLFFSREYLAISWNADGTINDNPDSKVRLYSDMNENFNIPPMFSIHNIGVGTAKKINITLNHSMNIALLNDYLHQNNSDVTFDYYVNGGLLQIKSKDMSLAISTPEVRYFDYMISDTRNDEQYDIQFPFIYVEALREICHLQSTAVGDLPSLELNISYQDIQGKEYKRTAFIIMRLMMMELEEDGSGVAVFDMEIK